MTMALLCFVVEKCSVFFLHFLFEILNDWNYKDVEMLSLTRTEIHKGGNG